MKSDEERAPQISLWGQLFGELVPNFTKPEIPDAYTGPTFFNTEHQGGYGWPSSSMYSLQTKGYATYGALGQGSSSSKNVDDNVSNRMRTMVVTVLPGDGFDQGGKTVKFEVGSYPWNPDLDLRVPELPFIYGYTHPTRKTPREMMQELGASFVKMTTLSAASAIALTLL